MRYWLQASPLRMKICAIASRLKYPVKYLPITCIKKGKKIRLLSNPERVQKHSTLNYMAILAMKELSSDVSEKFLL